MMYLDLNDAFSDFISPYSIKFIDGLIDIAFNSKRVSLPKGSNLLNEGINEHSERNLRISVSSEILFILDEFYSEDIIDVIFNDVYNDFIVLQEYLYSAIPETSRVEEIGWSRLEHILSVNLEGFHDSDFRTVSEYRKIYSGEQFERTRKYRITRAARFGTRTLSPRNYARGSIL